MGRKTWGLEHPRRNYLKNNYLPEKNLLSGGHIKSKVVCAWILSLWYRAVYLF